MPLRTMFKEMANVVVGLDIGTHAVRAAELSLGRDEPTLLRFGQVALEPGAVRDGEVVDPAAVAAALKRLWTEVGFKQRRVIVGVGNERVIVRQAELRAIPDEDLRSALQFEVQDLIPIPVDEAILDFQVLERYANAEQEPMMRILLVAAQRDMVQTLLAALDGAGLEASLVDVVPFALLRALGGTAMDLSSDRGPAEAIVDVGGGVTNVVVHEGGVPRFVRLLAVGGRTITDAIVDALGVDEDTAEDLKRRADPESSDQLEARAGQIVVERVTPLVEQIRGSLDYYRAQPDAAPLGRVLLTGGGTRTPGLLDRLGDLTGVPVEPAHPLLLVRVGRTGLAEEQLVDAEPLLSVPIGLGLAGRPAESGRRRLSLLPREIAAVREERRHVVLTAAAVGVLAMLLVGVWFLSGSKVDGEKTKAREAETRATLARAQIARLQDAALLDQEVAARRQMVQSALANDVSWTKLFNEVATVIPSDVWLTSFSGSRAAGGTGGTVNINGMGFDHTSAARWLLRVGDLPSLQNLWLPTSSKQGEGDHSLITFQSTATLTDKAQSDRLGKYLGDGR